MGQNEIDMNYDITLDIYITVIYSEVEGSVVRILETKAKGKSWKTALSKKKKIKNQSMLPWSPPVHHTPNYFTLFILVNLNF